MDQTHLESMTCIHKRTAFECKYLAYMPAHACETTDKRHRLSFPVTEKQATQTGLWSFAHFSQCSEILQTCSTLNMDCLISWPSFSDMRPMSAETLDTPSARLSGSDFTALDTFRMELRRGFTNVSICPESREQDKFTKTANPSRQQLYAAAPLE